MAQTPLNLVDGRVGCRLSGVSFSLFCKSVGHYTSLRVKLRPKTEFIPLYQFIFDNADSDSTWADAAQHFDYQWLRDWAEVGRCNFIPFGALAGTDWDEDDPEWSLAFDDSRIFVFQCSLKNYEKEIETWFELFKHTWVAADGWIYSEDWEMAARLDDYLDIN